METTPTRPKSAGGGGRRSPSSSSLIARQGDQWEWTKALPSFVIEHGWKAKSYGNGQIKATYYHVSLFDIPLDFWSSTMRDDDQQTTSTNTIAAAANGKEGEGESIMVERGDSGGQHQAAAGGEDKYHDVADDMILEGAEDEDDGAGEETPSTSTGTPAAATTTATTTTTTCSKCRYTATTAEERVNHYRSAWHLMNLRRSLAKKTLVSKEEFESIKKDKGDKKTKKKEGEEEEGSGSSNSSSEEEGEEGGERPEIQTESAEITITRPGALYAMTVWSVLLSNDARRESNATLLQAFTTTLGGGTGKASSRSREGGGRRKRLWAVLMLRSGKFAGAIFDESKVVIHKAFKRYTVRRKAGGSQGSFDNKGRKAQSVGSQLRRYGEQATREDVADILEQWASLLEECEYLFLSVPKTMRGVLMGAEKPLLSKTDPRIRSVPFMTEAPSFAEVQAVHARLATVRFSASSNKVDPQQQQQQQQQQSISSSATTDGALATKMMKASLEGGEGEKKVDQGEEQEEVMVKDEEWDDGLALLIKGGEVNEVEARLVIVLSGEAGTQGGEGREGGLIEAVEAGGEKEEGGKEEAKIEGKVSVLQARDAGGRTLLHLAAEGGNEEMIELLLTLGADPCALDLRERPPYFLCQTKGARDAFRRQRGLTPERWDWHRAGVPEALTEELERRKKEKLGEGEGKGAKTKKKADKEKQASQATDSPTDLPTYLPTYLSIYLPTYQPTYLPTYLQVKEKKKRAKTKKKADKEKQASKAADAEKRRQEGKQAEEERGSSDEEEEEDLSRPKCDACGKGVRVLYTRLEYIYCSTECVQAHKRTLLAEAAMKRFGGGGGAR